MKVETEKVWGWCRERGIPAIGFVTRLDRERASVDHALEDLKLLGVKPAVLQVPIGSEARVPAASSTCSPAAGVRLPGRLGHDEGGGRARRARRRGGARRASGWSRPSPRPTTSCSRSTSRASSCRRRSWRRGCARARARASSCPSCAARAPKGIGLHPLLDAIVDLLPSPADLPPWEGDDPRTGERVRARGRPVGAVLGLRLQDHRRSVRRQADGAAHRLGARARRSQRGQLVPRGQGAPRPPAAARGQEAGADPAGRGRRHRRAREAEGHPLGRHAVRRAPAGRLPAAARHAGGDLLRAPAEEQGRRRQGDAGRCTA